MNGLGLPASGLDLLQRTVLHGLLCRAFSDAEAARETAAWFGLAWSGGGNVVAGWKRVLDELRTGGDDVAPLAHAAFAVRPSDPDWLRIPQLAQHWVGAEPPPARVRCEVSARSIIAKVACDGTEGWGTAWRVDLMRALTAAHCVGDRAARTLAPGGVTLVFPGGAVGAEVRDVDWDLDVALLEVREPSPAREVPALARNVAQGETWRAWGFPVALETGIVAEGTVADTAGRLAASPGGGFVPALQLTCAIGGLGGLEGFSGAPVWGPRGVIGLVRWGPPRLGQRVIYATRVEEIVGRFEFQGARLRGHGGARATAARAG